MCITRGRRQPEQSELMCIGVDRSSDGEVCMYERIYLGMHLCTYICVYACMRMYVCMGNCKVYACVYPCMGGNVCM